MGLERRQAHSCWAQDIIGNYVVLNSTAVRKTEQNECIVYFLWDEMASLLQRLALSSDPDNPFPSNFENEALNLPGLPQEFPSKEETEKLLAASLNELPMKGRERVLHDIHGVADVFEEKDDFLSEKLRELDQEIQDIPTRSAYETAKSMSREYVSNREFRLKFLRSEYYNPKKAAAKLTKHFEWKMELFGECKLVRDILLSDLEPEEIEVIETGYFQLLAQRDRSGRAILCGLPSLTPNLALLKTRVS
jgi:hypothetical protein